MFSALCRRLLPLALGAGFVFSAAPAFSAPGETANAQARHIATFYPGRMTVGRLSPPAVRPDGLPERCAQLQYPLRLYR